MSPPRARGKMAVHGVWRHVNFPSKKKFKMLPSAGKVICTVFWDRGGVILLDFLEPRQTINSDHYIMTLTKLKARISRVRPEKRTTFLLQHNNVRPPTSLKMWSTLSNLAGLSYHTHHIVQIRHLLTSICSGR